MKKIKKNIISWVEKICKTILAKIEYWREVEQWRVCASSLSQFGEKDCSDTHALDFCIQTINSLVEEYSLKDVPGSKVIVVNGKSLADFIVKYNYGEFGEKGIKNIANSVLILCRKGENTETLLRINCTKDGMRSLDEFFQGKGYVSITV